LVQIMQLSSAEVAKLSLAEALDLMNDHWANTGE
jgi:hypothetical protein